MLKNLRKFTAVFTVFLLAVTMLSGFSASAKEVKKQEKLVVGDVGWDGVDVTEAAFPTTGFSDNIIGAYMYTTTVFALGLEDESGNVRPVPLDDTDKFVLVYENGKEVPSENYTFAGLIYLDENRNEVPVNVDGLFCLTVGELGTFDLVYKPDSADGTQMSIGVKVINPPIAVYRPDGTLVEPLIEYGKDREFYLLFKPIIMDEARLEIEVTDIKSDEGLVDITETDGGYKIVIPKEVNKEFAVEYEYIVHYAYKNGDVWDESEYYSMGYASFVPEKSKESAAEWKKTGDKWYYYDNKGGLEKNSYRDGWYLGNDGSWDGKTKAVGWKKNSKGWWYDLGGGKYLKNGWYRIDGVWYYFKADGYAAQNEWIKGYWLSSNCKWKYKARGKWHKNSKGWWYGDTSGWYAKNETVKIDGVEYSFNEDGYLKELGFH